MKSPPKQINKQSLSLALQSKRAREKHKERENPEKAIKNSNSSSSSSFCSSQMDDPIEIEFNNLPKDLLFDIFSRIPLKPLCQLRCVCKKWLFFLNLNPEFTSFYHQKHKFSPLLVFTKQNNETPSTQLSFYYIDGTQLTQFSTNFADPLTYILTCNGILCLISNSGAFLYEPITKRVSNLPNSTHLSSTFSWAFGQVSNPPFRNVFKLLHFYTTEKFDNFHYCQNKEVMCEIFTKPSSQIGSDFHGQWRNLGKCPFNVLGRKHYAYVDGKFYWLIGDKKYNPDCIKIMSFNLSSENFGLVCFPRKFSNRSVECLDVVEINEKLCLTDRLPWESTMDIWMMMKEDDYYANDMWVKMYSIDLMGIDHHDVRILGHFNENFDCSSDEQGKILIKFGAQSFGFCELENGLFKDLVLAGGISMQGWDLKLVLNRMLL